MSTLSVTLDDVKCIIDLDPNVSDTCWQAILDDACDFVLALGIDEECGEDRASAVAKYLAAHMMTFRDPRQTEQEIDDAKDKYTDKHIGAGFESSVYGQMAKRMDCTGQLADLDDEANNGTVQPKHIFCSAGR